MLREDQIERYARHILLREVGGKGQARLLRSSAAVHGVGGAGGWAVSWLALAGVGRLHLLDPAPIAPGPPVPFVEAAAEGLRRDRALAEAIPTYNPDVRCTWGELPDEAFSLHLIVDSSAASPAAEVRSGAAPPPANVSLFSGKGVSDLSRAGDGQPTAAHQDSPAFWLAAAGGATAMGWVEGAPPCVRCAGLLPEPPRASSAARAGSLAASRLLAFLLGLEAPVAGVFRQDGSDSHPVPACSHR